VPRPRAIVAIAAFLGTATLSVALSAASHAQQGKALRQFMRQKLDYAQRVLEGITLEDYALVAKNAKDLRTLSEDAQWRVSPNLQYLRLSSEFQSLADDLAQKARDRNLDGVTLGFFKLTNNCVACHKLVRDERLVTLRDP
jgi:hypothetical protein